MAQFRVASHASFRSESITVSAGLSISVTVRSLVRGRGGRDDRLVAELEQYTTPAEQLDLASALDRYPDEDTAEIREVLAGQRHAHA